MNTRIVLNADKKYGCAICFGRFEKDEKILVCQEPCNKLFHTECFDKSIEEVSLCDIKCCYCKRALITKENLFDRHNTFVRGLLRRGSIHELRNVIIACTGKEAIVLQPCHGKLEQHIKMPKQSKRGAYPPDPPMRTLYKRGCRS
jgi:hypothetical protein